MVKINAGSLFTNTDNRALRTSLNDEKCGVTDNNLSVQGALTAARTVRPFHALPPHPYLWWRLPYRRELVQRLSVLLLSFHRSWQVIG